MVSVVVFAFGDTALNFRPIILPINYDFPELTGPIKPILRAYAFYGLCHFPLYVSANTKSAFYTNLSYGI